MVIFTTVADGRGLTTLTTADSDTVVLFGLYHRPYTSWYIWSYTTSLATDVSFEFWIVSNYFFYHDRYQHHSSVVFTTLNSVCVTYDYDSFQLAELNVTLDSSSRRLGK